MTGPREGQLGGHLRRPGAVRQRGRQAVRLVADGTGLSESEVQWLFAMTAASAVLAGAAAAAYGLVRLVDFVTQG
jgi:hypothetical protein